MAWTNMMCLDVNVSSQCINFGADSNLFGISPPIFIKQRSTQSLRPHSKMIIIKGVGFKS